MKNCLRGVYIPAVTPFNDRETGLSKTEKKYKEMNYTILDEICAWGAMEI